MAALLKHFLQFIPLLIMKYVNETKDGTTVIMILNYYIKDKYVSHSQYQPF
jgi:hypothetical protein